MKLATMSIIVMVSMLFIISCSLDEEADDDGNEVVDADFEVVDEEEN
ncbi:MAG: hypothetical protein QF566_01755 [Candidatus Thalassarchaeaceae archaeon]|nr:hypothetical protein [Candidatus Thalassarchaeaceae archaeon]